MVRFGAVRALGDAPRAARETHDDHVARIRRAGGARGRRRRLRTAPASRVSSGPEEKFTLVASSARDFRWRVHLASASSRARRRRRFRAACGRFIQTPSRRRGGVRKSEVRVREPRVRRASGESRLNRHSIAGILRAHSSRVVRSKGDGRVV